MGLRCAAGHPSLYRVVNPRRAPGHPSLYRVVNPRGAPVRDGLELSSPVARTEAPGGVVSVSETAADSQGLQRVRLADGSGWTSLVDTDGAPVLERLASAATTAATTAAAAATTVGDSRSSLDLTSIDRNREASGILTGPAATGGASAEGAGGGAGGGGGGGGFSDTAVSAEAPSAIERTRSLSSSRSSDASRLGASSRGERVSRLNESRARQARKSVCKVSAVN